jgi:signal transduction histidine kinase
MRPATVVEAAAITRALPPLVGVERGVASVLIERAGVLLDGAVVLEAPDDVFVRPIPCSRSAELEAWLALLERQRNQVAHDLGGQATAVLAALETILEYEPIPPSTRPILDDARAGMLRLASLLRSAPQPDEPEVVDARLADLVTSVARALTGSLDPRLERIQLDVVADDSTVRADRTLVEAVLRTLLRNAWSFRKSAKASVTIDARHRDGVLALSVSDDGRGMAPATLRRAGELGYTTRASGIGLGLFQLRRIASRRRGALVLSSLRDGSRVTVLLRDLCSVDATLFDEPNTP